MTAATMNGQQEEAGTSLSIIRNKILNTVLLYADNIQKLAPRGMESAYYVEELRLYLSQPDKDGNPSKLFDCSPASIARGVLRVAQTGLSLGVSCDLLPFGGTCTFSPRYTGIIELALSSGVRAVNADVVYDDDILFEYQKGTSFLLNHRRGPRKGKITHFYAIGEIKTGSYVFEVMTRDEVEAHKTKFSKQWKTTAIEQCIWYGKKTAIRQLSKFLPKNSRFAAALQFDNDTTEDDVPEGEFEVVTPNAPRGEPAPAPIADRPASEAQVEHILDLLDNPRCADGRSLILERLKRGVQWSVAALWIDDLEKQLGIESSALQAS